jgi:hypothetical protein
LGADFDQVPPTLLEAWLIHGIALIAEQIIFHLARGCLQALHQIIKAANRGGLISPSIVR